MQGMLRSHETRSSSTTVEVVGEEQSGKFARLPLRCIGIASMCVLIGGAILLGLGKTCGASCKGPLAAPAASRQAAREEGAQPSAAPSALRSPPSASRVALPPPPLVSRVALPSPPLPLAQPFPLRPVQLWPQAIPQVQLRHPSPSPSPSTPSLSWVGPAWLETSSRESATVAAPPLRPPPPQLPPQLPPAAPTPSAPLDALCLSSFRATGVFKPTGVFRPHWSLSNPWQLPDPQVWVYLSRGGRIAGKTSVQYATLSPVWASESELPVCFGVSEAINHNICFDVRDMSVQQGMWHVAALARLHPSPDPDRCPGHERPARHVACCRPCSTSSQP